MPFLALPRPYFVLLLTTRVNVLPRTWSISLPKLSHFVISIVIIYLWFRPTSISWHGYTWFLKILSDIFLALSKLKMIYTVRKNKVYLTPDDSFSSFTASVLLVSSNDCHFVCSHYFLLIVFRVAGSRAIWGLYLFRYLYPYHLFLIETGSLDTVWTRCCLFKNSKGNRHILRIVYSFTSEREACHINFLAYSRHFASSVE